MKKVLAFVLLAIAMPAFAGDLSDLARDLERALGRGSVQVSGKPARLSAHSLLAEMNRERAAFGLTPLRLDSRLSMAAEDRIDDMFSKGYFDHVAPDGTQPFVWAERRGYDYRTIGENLAVGYRTSQRVVDGWMHSAGHRRNILGREFDEVGIAITLGAPMERFAGPTIVVLYAAR
jgi:uncharacterized protein YkwD